MHDRDDHAVVEPEHHAEVDPLVQLHALVGERGVQELELPERTHHGEGDHGGRLDGDLVERGPPELAQPAQRRGVGPDGHVRLRRGRH